MATSGWIPPPEIATPESGGRVPAEPPVNGGYDNWRVDVHTIPEPRLGVLLLLATILHRHRRSQR